MKNKDKKTRAHHFFNLQRTVNKANFYMWPYFIERLTGGGINLSSKLLCIIYIDRNYMYHIFMFS